MVRAFPLLSIGVLVPLFGCTSGDGTGGPTSVPSPPVSTSDGPMQDFAALQDTVLPFAEKMLTEHRAFLPFGATMSTEGEVGQSAGWTGEEQPDPTELVRLLEDGFRTAAAAGTIRASALAVDVRTVPPGRTEKQDAIAIGFDHSAMSLLRLFPYRFTEEGRLVIEEPYDQPGAGTVFP